MIRRQPVKPYFFAFFNLVPIGRSCLHLALAFYTLVCLPNQPLHQRYSVNPPNILGPNIFAPEYFVPKLFWLFYDTRVCLLSQPLHQQYSIDPPNMLGPNVLYPKYFGLKLLFDLFMIRTSVCWTNHILSTHQIFCAQTLLTSLNYACLFAEPTIAPTIFCQSAKYFRPEYFCPAIFCVQTFWTFLWYACLSAEPTIAPTIFYQPTKYVGPKCFVPKIFWA